MISISKRRFIQNALLLLCSLLFTLLGLELFFRFYKAANFHSLVAHSTKSWPDQEKLFNKKVVRQSPGLGYEWTPNASYGGLLINSLGMRDKERSIKKAPGAYRIIFLGDSTTATSNYVMMLEDQLNKGAHGHGRSFEAWNCSVVGYSLIQYCRAIEEKWLSYDPDMIVIGFCLNDFDTTPLVLREGGILVGYFPRQEILPHVNPFLFKYSALYRFIVKVSLLENKHFHQNTYQASLSAFEKTIATLGAHKVRLLVVVLGLTKTLPDCGKDRLDNYGRIISFCERHSIDYIDTMPLFQKENPEQFSSNDDIHFNDKGSVVVAGAIQEYLEKAGIAAASGDPRHFKDRKK